MAGQKTSKNAQTIADMLGIFGNAKKLPDHVSYLLSQGRTDEAIEAMKEFASGVRPGWDAAVPPRQRPEVRMQERRPEDTTGTAMIVRGPDTAGDAVRRLLHANPAISPLAQSALFGGGAYGLYRLAQKDGEPSAARKGPEPSREEEVAARYGQDLLEQVYERGRK